MIREELYRKCVDFHGHSCGGLLVGFRAAICAMERFGIDGRAQDDELVCVAENDACGIDHGGQGKSDFPSARKAGFHVL